MQLNVLERFATLNVLPRKGNLRDLIIAKNICEAVTFTEDEMEALGVAPQPDGRIVWDAAKSNGTTKAIDLTCPQIALLVDILRKLDQAGELTPDHVSLCEKLGIGQE